VFEPGDVEFYLLNRLESRRSYDYRSSVRTDCARQKRYEHCDDLFIIGAHGQTNNCCPGCHDCYPTLAPVSDPGVPLTRAGVPPEPADSGKGEAHLSPPTIPTTVLLPVPEQRKAEQPKP
jgi:pilus assembly protein CpaC